MTCYRQLFGDSIFTDVQGLDTGRVHDALIQLQKSKPPILASRPLHTRARRTPRKKNIAATTGSSFGRPRVRASGVAIAGNTRNVRPSLAVKLLFDIGEDRARLRRDLPHCPGAVGPAIRGRSVQIAGCVQRHAAPGMGSVVATGESVEIGVRPAAARRT